jgi:hypothetical protein
MALLDFGGALPGKESVLLRMRTFLAFGLVDRSEPIARR